MRRAAVGIGLLILIYVQTKNAQVAITVALVTWCVLYAIDLVKYLHRQRRVIQILMVSGNPQQYLYEMSLLKSRAFYDKLGRLIEVNMALGLIYDGRAEEALVVLESVSIRGFKPLHRGLYYNSLALAYLMMNRVSEAQEIFKVHIGEMLAADRDFMIRSCARCTRAILDYKQNRDAVALETLERLLKCDLMPVQKSQVLYYKGLILSERGHVGVENIFEESAALAGDTTYKSLSSAALRAVRVQIG